MLGCLYCTSAFSLVIIKSVSIHFQKYIRIQRQSKGELINVPDSFCHQRVCLKGAVCKFILLYLIFFTSIRTRLLQGGNCYLPVKLLACTLHTSGDLTLPSQRACHSKHACVNIIWREGLRRRIGGIRDSGGWLFGWLWFKLLHISAQSSRLAYRTFSGPFVWL